MMHHNTPSAVLPRPSEACVFDLGSLYAHFAQLVDKRQARGKRYPLALVLVLFVLAKLCGEDKPYGIAEWVQNRAGPLLAVFGVQRQHLPCHNTYRRVLATSVVPSALQATVSRFLCRNHQAGADILVTFDGKTMRGTIPAASSQGVQLLAVFLPHEGVVLAQVAVAAKENEIVAAPQVLATVDLRNTVVIGDALQTQKELSVQVVQAGGNYIWYVKDNHPQLRDDIEHVFQPESHVPGFSPLAKDFQTAHHTQKGHGRVDERTLTTSCLLNDYLDWPYLAQVFKLERRRTKLNDGTTAYNVVYGISSLTRQEASAERLLKATQEYWGIENGLHYRRDRTLREDDTRITDTTRAEAIAILNNLVIGMILRAGWRYLPAARRHYDADLAMALRLVLTPPT
jgi:predicted transposase YbfD/YdcC